MDDASSLLPHPTPGKVGRRARGLPSRRAFLAALAATGATGFASGLVRPAAAATKMRRIDMHHHFLPQQFMREEAERLSLNHGNSAMLSWTAEDAIQACDKAGVDFAVASISTPGVWQGDIPLGRKLARQWNEAAARTVHDHPTRFGFFAPVPLPDTEGCLQEIDYALGTLHADGINFLSNYDGKVLGDPAFTPVMEELDRRNALVYVHSTFSPCCSGTMVPGLGATTIEFPYDTLRTIVSLITSGTTTRFPRIRFIFSHGGGALMGVYGRIVGLDNAPAFKGKFPAGMHDELAKLFYDTASLDGGTTLAALLKVVPASQILLGSDYPLAGPPPTDVMIERAVARFEASKPSPRLKHMIEHDNAIRLLPRIAKI
jgi:predicted TIM-barrel fold metal-dependent hydrolase